MPRELANGYESGPFSPSKGQGNLPRTGHPLWPHSTVHSLQIPSSKSNLSPILNEENLPVISGNGGFGPNFWNRIRTPFVWTRWIICSMDGPNDRCKFMVNERPFCWKFLFLY
jgi:hypothetical protein